MIDKNMIALAEIRNGYTLNKYGNLTLEQNLLIKYDNLCLNLIKENQELKKQLESANEQISYLRRSIERKEERIIDLQNERIPYTNEYVDKLENRQKEFIKYLEDKIKYFKDIEQYAIKIFNNKAVINLDLVKSSIEEDNLLICNFEEILQKYKEIIGDDK